MNGVAMRMTVLAVFGALVLLPACGGRSTGTVPRDGSVQLATAKSISPASVPAPPMVQTKVLPSSVMSGVRLPKSAIGPTNWTQLPGGAIFVAASPDGSIWVLSNQGGGLDRAIWHYAGGTWTNIPGAAMRLAVAPNNTLWVVNSAGGIYSWNGSAWSTIAGGASDITVGADGTVYVISNQGGGPYGRGIWHYASGTWTQLPGAAVRIAATWDLGSYPPNIAPGGFFVVSATNSVYFYNPSSGFAQQPGGVVLVAPTKSGGLFALGYIGNSDGSYPIYYEDLSNNTWTQQAGAAISIATDGTHVYAIGAAGGIYSAPITAPTPTPAATPTATPTPVSTATPVGSCLSSAHRMAASGGRLAPRSRGGIVPNQLYVRYAATARATDVQSIERSSAVVRSADLGTSRGQRLRAITLAPGVDANATAASLRRSAGVVAVSPVHYRGLTGDAAAGANDQYFDNARQWYLYKTNVVKNGAGNGAWNLTTGRAGVSVAVIDTGVDLTGPNLGGNDFAVDVAEKTLSGITTTGNAAVQDTNGHGTNTSGLATAQANNSYGFAGVGYSIHLQAYKIFPDGSTSGDETSASTTDEAIAINHAVAHGASVISLSLGSSPSGGPDDAEQTAIENALSNNVVVVAAAGNECPDGDGGSPDYPAAYPGVIAVGATSVNDTTANDYTTITGETIASYSNSGPTLVAPGGDPSDTSDHDLLHWIEGYSTTTDPYVPDQCTNSGSPPTCRVLFAGTSQATPQVAGTVALMESYHGGARSLTPAQVTQLLTSTADVIPGYSSARQGAGRLNAGKAVAAAHP